MDNIAHAIPFLESPLLQMIFELTLILVGGAIVNIVINRLLRRVIGDVEVDKHPWLAAVADLLPRVASWTLWLFVLTFLIQIAAERMQLPAVSQPIGQIRQIGLTLIITWLLYQWKNGLKDIFGQRVKAGDVENLDRATVTALDKLASILIVVGAGVTVLQILEVEPAAVWAVGGAGVLGTSLAAKDIISNFFGGFMIFVTRPFSEGDWINSPDKSIEGVVERIGWYHSTIRSFDKRPIYVPNALFTSMVLVNPSRMTNRRIRETVGIRYDDFDQVRPVVSAIEAMLKEHKDIDHNMALMVHFTQFGPSSLDINIYCFTITTNWAEWRSIQQDVLLKVGEIIEAHKAEIAYPTHTVHMANQAVEPQHA